MLLIGLKSASTNQKHYPDLGSDALIVWSFCVRFSDVILRENQRWRRGMTAVLSGSFSTEAHVQLRGMAITLRMRTAILPQQWQ